MRKWIAGAAAVLTLTGAGGAVAAAASTTGSRPTLSAQAAPTQTAAPAKGNRANVRKLVVRGAIRVSAHTIGITPKELATDLRNGQSVADVAAAHHVDRQKVIDALVAAADKRIDAAASKGKLTPQRAATLKTKVPAAAAKFVDHHRTPKPATGN